MIMSELFSDKLISNILRFKRDQNGSVLVIMAVALVVILGMAALVVDVGALVLEKGRLQNACDAAALAAVRVAYDDSQTNARNEAEKYLDENDADYEVDNVIFNSDKTVTVSASSTVNYAFAKVLGIYSGTVDANATAVYGPVKSITGKKGVIGGVDPIGISEEVVRDEDFEFGKEYTLITADNWCTFEFHLDFNSISFQFHVSFFTISLKKTLAY
jgi:Flp pilus assembly protein TadG